VKARKNVPSVEGAATLCPSTRLVCPERNTSQSSMQSAPSIIADTKVMTLVSRVRRPDPAAKIDRLLDQRLQLEPPGEQRRQ
jgi:hypothetical protein